MNFSDNLKKIRKEHNLSQEQIAEQLGVSRQSVSKWEQGLAYPEMDKMLSLCKIFNLNIDDLLNQDINEVNNTKQAKNNINKFIDDFLEYITKTIDMFSNMNLKQKLKCIFEQLVIITFIALTLLILGSILSSISYNLFSSLPNNIYRPIHHILEAIYLILCLILSITLILHIFKVRYLDYYQIINVDKQEPIINIPSEPKIINLNKHPQIIIRDPKHTGYKTISTLLNILLFFIKTFATIPAFFLSLYLIFLTILLVLSFLIIKSGLLFIGIFLIILSIITINIILLNIIYRFIVNQKTKKNPLAITFLISLITLGIGIGLTITSILNLKITDNLEHQSYNKIEYNIPMTEDTYINSYYKEIEYIESNNQDIKLVINKTDYFTITLHEYPNNNYNFHYELSKENFPKLINQTIKDINNKEFIDYSNYEIKIYTTKDNINKLKQN